MTFGARVNAFTQELLLPKSVDNVMNSNVLALRLFSKAKKGAGVSIDKPIVYESTGTATSFAGLDTFTAAAKDNVVKISYDMRGARNPIAVSGFDATANAVGQTQITDMVKEAVEWSTIELANLVGTLIYGTGTGNSNKDFIGLGAIVDDGTDVTTLGGLSRTTYSVLNATRTASGGALTLGKMATLYSAVSSGSNLSSPTIGVSNETVWDLYETLLNPTVRESYSMTGPLYVGARGTGVQRQAGLEGQAGFVALSYRGVPIVRDEKATAQNLFFLNENWIQWYGWKPADVTNYKSIGMTSEAVEGLYEEQPMSNFTGFSWSGWRLPTNSMGMIADFVVMGNATTFQPRRQGRLTGITSA